MLEEFLYNYKSKPVLWRHMGIPITVYFLLCTQSTSNYVAVLSVLTADLVVVHTCLEVVVGTLDAWSQCTWILNLLTAKGTSITGAPKQCRLIWLLSRSKPHCKGILYNRNGICQSVHTGWQFLMLPVHCLSIYSIMSNTDPSLQSQLCTLHICWLLSI